VPADTSALRRSSLYAAIAVFGLAAVVILPYLGGRSLADWDEAIYAQVSKEILATNNWLTLHWHYNEWFEKPPLLMWLTAVLFKFFGIAETWVRLPSAAAGIGTAWITYLLGARIYSRAVGVIAAGVLLSGYHFVGAARFGTTDVLLTFFTYVAIYAAVRTRETGRWWILAGVAMGLGIMTKGAAGVIAPAVIGITLLITGRIGSTLRDRGFWFGVLAGFTVALPWHLALYFAHGDIFLAKYIGYHVLERTAKPLEGHVGGAAYYVYVLFLRFAPWAWLVPAGIVCSIKEHLEDRSRSPVLLVATAFVLLITTAVKTKLEWYVVPIYPALAVLIAVAIYQAYKRSEPAYWSLLFCAGLAAHGAGLRVSLLVAAALAVTVFAPFVRRQHVVAACGAVVFLVALHGLQSLYQGGATPVAMLATRIAQERDDVRNPVIVASGQVWPTPLFYSGHVIQAAFSDEQLRQFTEGKPPQRILIKEQDVARLAAQYEFRVLEREGDWIYAVVAVRP
jgi:4-amino-4-deoxy-L-arabinose transferase-like glycosyltransferase